MTNDWVPIDQARVGTTEERMTCEHGSSLMIGTPSGDEVWSFGEITCPHGTTFGPSISRLATERLSVLERITVALYQLDVAGYSARWYRAKVVEILDAEADR